LIDFHRNLPGTAGVNVIAVQVDVAEDLDAAFDTIRRERADGLMVAGSAITYRYYDRVVAFSAENTCRPSMRSAKPLRLVACFRMARPGIFRQMARLTDRVLKGSRPQDLPTEQATSFELVLNVKTAKILGLTVSPTMLAVADEVIE
jgi:putative ABC transport system substrate-binding protein